MITIDKNYPELIDMHNWYTLDYISSNESVNIDLDKPLIVTGPVYVDGNLISNINMQAKTFQINGFVDCQNIFSSNEYTRTAINVEDSLKAKTVSIQSGNMIVKNDINTSDNIYANCTRNIQSVNGSIHAKSIYVQYGNLLAKKDIVANEIRANNIMTHGQVQTSKNIYIRGCKVDYAKYKHEAKKMFEANDILSEKDTIAVSSINTNCNDDIER